MGKGGELGIKEDSRLLGWRLACGSENWDSLDMHRPRRQFCRETLVLTNMLAVRDTLESVEEGGSADGEVQRVA